MTAEEARRLSPGLAVCDGWSQARPAPRKLRAKGTVGGSPGAQTVPGCFQRRASELPGLGRGVQGAPETFSRQLPSIRQRKSVGHLHLKIPHKGDTRKDTLRQLPERERFSGGTHPCESCEENAARRKTGYWSENQRNSPSSPGPL